jgi:hypothetical protein
MIPLLDRVAAETLGNGVAIDGEYGDGGSIGANIDRLIDTPCHIADGPVLDDTTARTQSEEADSASTPDIPFR